MRLLSVVFCDENVMESRPYGGLQLSRYLSRVRGCRHLWMHRKKHRAASEAGWANLNRPIGTFDSGSPELIITTVDSSKGATGDQ